VSEDEQTIDLAEPVRVSTETRDFGTMLAKLTRELDQQEEEMSSRAHAGPVILPDEEAPVAPREHYRRVVVEPPAGPSAPVSEAVSPRSRHPCRHLLSDDRAADARRRARARAHGHAMTIPSPERMPAGDRRLATLGLPPELVPSVAASGDLRTAIVQRLSQLPPRRCCARNRRRHRGRRHRHRADRARPPSRR